MIWIIWKKKMKKTHSMCMYVIKGWLRLFVDYVDCRVKGQLQKLHYLSEFLRLREILNFFQQRMSRRFKWNRPHRPIGRPNWPNRPFFEWNQIFSSKSWKMTQIPAKLCRPEVADASNLGQKYVQLVPKVLLHTQNVQKYVLHVYLWKKNVSHKFFFKKIAPKLKKNSYFFRSKFFGKNWKKIFFQVWNLVNLFCKK